jgi:hypothetical protein
MKKEAEPDVPFWMNKLTVAIKERALMALD